MEPQSKKRKRDTSHPRITFHASDRTFDRLFKEDSLAELKNVVRRKLGHSQETAISLAQIRDGKFIDLEDDDDFDAFYAVAHSTSTVDVRVVIGQAADFHVRVSVTPSKKKSNEKQLREPSEPHVAEVLADMTIESASMSVPLVQMSSPTPDQIQETGRPRPPEAEDNAETEPPKKKRRQESSKEHTATDTASSKHAVDEDAISVEKTHRKNKKDSRPTRSDRSRLLRGPNRSSSSGAIQRAQNDEPSVTPAQEEDQRVEYTEAQKPTEKGKGKSLSVPRQSFVETLADTISMTGEANKLSSPEHPQDKVETRRKMRPSAQQSDKLSISTSAEIDEVNASLRDSQTVVETNGAGRATSRSSATIKGKRKARGRTSTPDEREAADADARALVSKLMARKRALLGSSTSDVPFSRITSKPSSGAKTRRKSHVPVLTVPPAISPKTPPMTDMTPESPKTAIASLDFTTAAPQTNNSSSSRSSSDSSEEFHGIQRPPMIPQPESTSAKDYLDIDLEALIRGPKVSGISIPDILSSDPNDDGKLSLEEDEPEDTSRKHIRRAMGSDSSDEVADENEESNDNEDSEQATRIPTPPIPVNARSEKVGMLNATPIDPTPEKCDASDLTTEGAQRNDTPDVPIEKDIAGSLSQSAQDPMEDAEGTIVHDVPRPSRLHPPVVTPSQSHKKPIQEQSMSLDTWTTLKLSSPVPEAESTVMVDELAMSSPDTTARALAPPENSGAEGGDPLFLLTESQPPFPYSQWKEPGKDEKTGASSDESEDEDEVETAVKSQSRGPSHGSSRGNLYRRLTDIASQPSPFSKNSRPVTRTVVNWQTNSLYGTRRAEEEEETSSSSSDTDSDVGNASHIPKTRRAGVVRRLAAA